jgi:hypothetical protein
MGSAPARETGELTRPLTLAELYKVAQADRMHRPPPEKLSALRDRVTAGREKIAAASAREGVDPKKLRAAKMTLAKLEDELTELLKAEVRWLATDAAYLVGRALIDLRPVVAEGSTLTFYLPDVCVVSLALDGPTDEPPF